MSSPTPRQELLQLHKKIYRQNKKIIEASVMYEDKSFKTYEKHYLKAVSRFRSVSSQEEMLAAVRESRLVYVGDYHTLKQSQRSLLRLLRALIEQHVSPMLGFEVIQSKHQEDLDRFMAGRLSEVSFLNRIGFREHWFFDLWKNFRPLFDFAREHHIPLYGLEGDPNENPNLKTRDEAMAKQIASLTNRHPDRLLIVFVGDLHLAPEHLPREVQKVFSRLKLKSPNFVILYQNSDAIYWKLSEKEMEERVDMVRVNPRAFCRMHTPPIICQQSYLNWLEHEEGEFDYADAKHTFVGYMDQMAQYLEIPLGPEKEEVEVFTCGDLSFLKRLKESGDFSVREIKTIKKQILRSESYYIPKKKFVYLANVSVNHTAEEASHTLRHLCAGDEFPRSLQDAFYANILHEALGFFGSKIINHRRKCLRPTDARLLLSYLKKTAAVEGHLLDYDISRFFLEHEAPRQKRVPFHTNRVAALSHDLFMGLTHALGYYLGEKMFYGLLQGKISKKEISNLFYDPMKETAAPVGIYFETAQKLKKVRLPVKT